MNNKEFSRREISFRLRKKRLELGYTFEYVYNNTSLSLQTIKNAEKGTFEFKIGTLIELASLYGLSTDYILGLNDESATDSLIVLISQLNEKEKSLLTELLQIYLLKRD